MFPKLLLAVYDTIEEIVLALPEVASRCALRNWELLLIPLEVIKTVLDELLPPLSTDMDVATLVFTEVMDERNIELKVVHSVEDVTPLPDVRHLSLLQVLALVTAT